MIRSISKKKLMLTNLGRMFGVVIVLVAVLIPFRHANAVMMCFGSNGNSYSALSSISPLTVAPGGTLTVSSSFSVSGTNSAPVSVSTTANGMTTVSGLIAPSSVSYPSFISGSAVLTAPMTPGSYSVTVTDNASPYCAPASFSYAYTVVASAPPPPPPPVTTGSITVNSNLSLALWTITGPATYTGTGMSGSYANVPMGMYTINWGAVAGYITPAPQTTTLGAGLGINFIGTYTLNTAGTGQINVNVLNAPQAPFTITGPSNIVVPAPGYSTASYSLMPAGSYTITWGAVTGYTTPASQTLSLTSGSFITFDGNYVASGGGGGVAPPPPPPPPPPPSVPAPTASIITPTANLSTLQNTPVLFSGSGTGADSSGIVLGQYNISGGPSFTAFDSATNAIWVTNPSFNVVTKLDAVTGALVGTYNAGGNGLMGIVFDSLDNSVWVVNSQIGAVTKLNAFTGAVIGTYPVGTTAYYIAFDPASNSVFVQGDATLSPVVRMNGTTGAVVGTYTTGAITPRGLAFDAASGSAWVVDNWSSKVFKVTPFAGGANITSVPTGVGPSAVTYDPSTQSVWVANYSAGTITKIQATTGSVLGTYAIPGNPYESDIIFDPATNSLWVAFAMTKIAKINPATGAIIGTYTFADAPNHIVSSPPTNSIWFTTPTSNRVTKISNGINSITGYEWRENNCSIGTLLSSASSFNLLNPTVGVRTIYLNVKDSFNTWSTNCPNRIITVLTPYLDIGLRASDGVTTYRIAAEPLGTVTSKLRISKAGTTYGIVLVPTTDPMATKFRINTSTGVMALRKL